MKPEDYNRKQYALGVLTYDRVQRIHTECKLTPGERGHVIGWSARDTGDWETISHVVAIWQSVAGLIEDGCFGPASLRRYMALYESGDAMHPIAAAALDVARESIGKGEEGGDNCGEWLNMIRMWPNGEGATGSIGHWCEFFANFCVREGASRTNRTIPFAVLFRDKDRNKLLPIGSAKTFVDRMAAAGCAVDLDDVRAGDYVAWNRGTKGSRQGHIEMVEAVERDEGGRIVKIVTIAGNVKQHGQELAVVHRREYTRDSFANAGQGLYLIARMV